MKIGTYLRADDDLLDSLTPKECLIFAMKMRTHYSEAIIDSRVTDCI